MKNRVELLAPAGNYEAFLGAVNAGADAVYMGGDKFGARAYADNFSADKICQAIHTAHFMGKKIYLTVNTLIKDSELSELYDWLLPFYEAGLDGVIVQDIGVLCYIRDHFKDLALHASTQMSLTGAGGAAFMKKQGAVRIVPARELSLQEIRKIKEQTGLEIECFIHGAMCYSYSGQCLFSSILGGRSGNRGRCAQPCRLPYQIYEGNGHTGGVDYPLSLKDMCTISYIPQLIEAGIDSFKIEGRMKKPEYAAGVTAIYRKYIDLYEEKGAGGYHVASNDLEMLRSLYIRSEVQTGYYERHNGREMITLHKPSYEGSDRDLLNRIRPRYIRDVDKLPVEMHVTLKVGEPVSLRIMGPKEVSVTINGSTVEAARKMPLQPENIRKQMEKTGSSLVKAENCNIAVQEDVFLPISALNELRRQGVEAFETQYIKALGMIAGRDRDNIISVRTFGESTESVNNVKKTSHMFADSTERRYKNTAVDVLVSTYEQLAAAAGHPCRRIYIDSDLYLSQHEHVAACMEEYSEKEYYLALPYILRAEDEDYLRRLKDTVKRHIYAQDNVSLDVLGNHGRVIRGFLIRNYEAAAYVESMGDSYAMVPDAGLYVFNRESALFWLKYAREYTLPYELNVKEISALAAYTHSIGICSTMIVYGRIPMMITANCIKKTAGHCNAGYNRLNNLTETDESMRIRDRYGTNFPVETNCRHCYNIIYNSVPYSLHLQTKEILRAGADIWRYDFTVESGPDCIRILEGIEFPYEKHTTGHLKRGVE